MVVLGGLGPAIYGLIIVLVVVLILLVIGLAILERTPSTHLKARDEAFEALKLRYAKGEITKEQFQEMKKTLGAEA
jgi:putative membrane protein